MRRVRAEKVCVGEIELEKGEAHHARDVLRMKVGEEIEVFDDAGGSAVGKILRSDRKRVVVAVERVNESAPAGFAWTVASAVPKGSRGDWMIEKLSELGTSLFIPLAAKRSVVLPEGKGKRGRWERLASEAAKQSKRRGVMGIGELMTVAEVVGGLKDSRGWYLSTAKGARPMAKVIGEFDAKKISHLTLLVGPEGGWTEEEMGMMDRAGLTGVAMGGTILRVETAAVAAAAIVAGVVAPMHGDSGELENA